MVFRSTVSAGTADTSVDSGTSILTFKQSACSDWGHRASNKYLQIALLIEHPRRSPKRYQRKWLDLHHISSQSAKPALRYTSPQQVFGLKKGLVEIRQCHNNCLIKGFVADNGIHNSSSRCSRPMMCSTSCCPSPPNQQNQTRCQRMHVVSSERLVLRLHHVVQSVDVEIAR